VDLILFLDVFALVDAELAALIRADTDVVFLWDLGLCQGKLPHLSSRFKVGLRQIIWGFVVNVGGRVDFQAGHLLLGGEWFVVDFTELRQGVYLRRVLDKFGLEVTIR